jgi:hypothetical protein
MKTISKVMVMIEDEKNKHQDCMVIAILLQQTSRTYLDYLTRIAV